MTARILTYYEKLTTEQRETIATLRGLVKELTAVLGRFHDHTYGKTDLVPALDFEQARALLAKAREIAP